jgi:hypothetical protein
VGGMISTIREPVSAAALKAVVPPFIVVSVVNPAVP